MRPGVEEYDRFNLVHRRLLEGILPIFQQVGYPEIRIFIFKSTGEFVILDVSDLPGIVWIDYMHIYKTFDTFLQMIEDILKTMKAQSIRYLVDNNMCPPNKILCRNINTLISNKYMVKDVRMKGSPTLCMYKTLSKRSTASTTVLNSIEEEDHDLDE